ncbi:L-serine ammonia-lyase, iron-sulfur-dependent subunit beta [Ruminococcaceae bacterium OttesenSCG-928-D13]|nr:L-serine ammonia-lyase, iron-sulfur-dependent subunit beta [Ruminococcaceae bacterium OttesenSCG-928-D13]
MELSIFEVLGPVMIGPSSSHTAGAARLARVAAEIAQKPFGRVEFGLSGSFAKTCRGHGTDKALLAGAIGLSPDDEQIADAEKLAAKAGVEWRLYREDLDWMHENSVHIIFHHEDDTSTEIWGSSIGGGRIEITRIGDFETRIHAENPTMLVNHLDRPGVISELSRVLAHYEVNIAVLRLSRVGRGRQANAMFIVDNEIPQAAVDELNALPHVEEVVVVDVS